MPAANRQLLDELEVVADAHRLHRRMDPSPCGLCGSPVVDRELHRLFHLQLERLSGTVRALTDAASPNPGQW